MYYQPLRLRGVILILKVIIIINKKFMNSRIESMQLTETPFSW